MSFSHNNTASVARIVLFIIAVALAIILVLVATSSYGTGLSPDSVGYISIARQIAEGNGYVDRYGEDVAVWPPLYPFVLGVIQLLFSVDPLEATRFINALAFGLNVALALWIVAQNLPLKFVFAAFLWLGFSLPLLQVSVMAWSEPLFILFSLGWLISLNAYLSRTRERERENRRSCAGSYLRMSYHANALYWSYADRK